MRAVAVDTETTGVGLRPGFDARGEIDRDHVFAVSTCDESMKTRWWEWPVNPYTRKPSILMKGVKELLEYLKTFDTLVFHNAKFDLLGLQNVPLWNVRDVFRRWVVDDTVVMSHVIDSSEQHGLKPLALKFLDYPEDDLEELLVSTRKARRIAARTEGYVLGDGVRADYWLNKVIWPDSKLCETYGRGDAARTMGLWKLFVLWLKDAGLEDHYYKRERPLIEVVWNMEQTGVTLKPRCLHTEIRDRVEESARRERQFCKAVNDIAGIESINIRSPKQLANLFYRNDKLPSLPTKTLTKTDYSMAAEVIEANLNLLSPEFGPARPETPQVKLLRLLQAYRGEYKKADYLKTYNSHTRYDPDGSNPRLHPSWNQVGARTTRFTCSRPTLQNVGVRGEMAVLRSVFGPKRGMVWLCCDYNQIELRILAALSGEENMQEVYRLGGDIHQQTADLCGIDRYPAKQANYMMVYGGGKNLLRRATGIDDMGERFFKAYPAVKRYFYSVINQFKKKGYVYTITGYRLYPPEERPYAALDYVIQGSAGDFLKYAMLNIHDKISSVRMIMTIHDELVVQLPKERLSKPLVNEIRRCMEEPGKEWGVETPVEITIVRNKWSEPRRLTM